MAKKIMKKKVAKKVEVKKKKYTIKDLLNLRMKGGPKNLSDSRVIDKIVYGV